MTVIQPCVTVIQSCVTVMQPCVTVIQPCVTVIQSCVAVIQSCVTVIQSCATVPGLDYVSHEDVLPYKTTESQPIHNHLFDKFLAHDPASGRCCHLLGSNRRFLFITKPESITDWRLSFGPIKIPDFELFLKFLNDFLTGKHKTLFPGVPDFQVSWEPCLLLVIDFYSGIHCT